VPESCAKPKYISTKSTESAHALEVSGAADWGKPLPLLPTFAIAGGVALFAGFFVGLFDGCLMAV
jgi:hypothetical protein